MYNQSMSENERKLMSERTVSLEGMDQEQAQKRFEDESRTVGGEVGGIQDAVIKFTQIDDFTTFRAEYSWVDDNLIIHFFLTKEMVELNKTEEGGPSVKQYWLNKFPHALERASKEYFQADSPRLTAKYTTELASWFFRAQGYADRLDPGLFAEKFFEHLDQVLESPQTIAGAAGN